MPQFSTLKIIKSDYLALILATAGPIFLAVSTLIGAFEFIPGIRWREGQEIDHTFVVGAMSVVAILTILGWLFLARRVARFNRILRFGVRVPATIIDVYFIKDRGRIEYRYTYEGVEHRAGAAIMKNKRTRDFATGDEIEIAVDPNNCRRAIIVSLFV